MQSYPVVYCPPILSHKKHSFKDSSQSDSKSFSEELEEWLDLTEDVPVQFQDHVQTILDRDPIPVSIAAGLAMDFYEEGDRCVREINRGLLNGYSNESFEYLLDIYSKLLFVLVIEYGSDIAMRKIVELWNHLSEKSSLFDGLMSYIRLMVSDTMFPLTCIENHSSREVVSSHIRLKCRETIQHTVPQEKARKIYV